jgi:hypothetical protein
VAENAVLVAEQRIEGEDVETADEDRTERVVIESVVAAHGRRSARRLAMASRVMGAPGPSGRRAREAVGRWTLRAPS